jgi:hypothetical protein
MKTFKQLINILRETAGAEEEAVRNEKARAKRKELITGIRTRLKKAMDSRDHSQASKHRATLQNAIKGLKRIG